MKIVAKNRRATYDYQLDERLVAGLVLTGAEVKSIKLGHASLKGSFVAIREGQAYLQNAQVTPYNMAGNASGLDPTRPRKLLLHQKQLNNLIAEKQAGRQIIPTALGIERNFVKLELAVGRGKKSYDKRQVIKQREVNIETRRAAKNV